MPVSQFRQTPPTRSTPSPADGFVDTPSQEGSFTVSAPETAGSASPGGSPAQTFSDTEHHETRADRGPIVVTRAKSGPNRIPGSVDTFKDTPGSR